MTGFAMKGVGRGTEDVVEGRVVVVEPMDVLGCVVEAVVVVVVVVVVEGYIVVVVEPVDVVCSLVEVETVVEGSIFVVVVVKSG